MEWSGTISRQLSTRSNKYRRFAIGSGASSGGWFTRVAERIEPMITTKDKSVMMGMDTMSCLQISAGGKLVLQLGGNHLMITELKQRPGPGSK